LLLAALGGGTFDVGYVMSAEEIQFWQDQAALLDPLAYEYVFANSTSRTNSDGRPWYLVNGWQLDATGAGTRWQHRPGDVNRAMPLSDGTTITTGNPGGGTTSFMYLCKPYQVADPAGSAYDSRYTDDPRALYFERLAGIASRTQYMIGADNTGTSVSVVALPTDFTYGMALHTSVNDVAWLIFMNSAGTDGVSNTHNEISDSDRIRWAEPTIMPFTRSTFPKIGVRGAGQSDGHATLTYLKLPDTGW
jgi:hypothetical protein